MTAKTIGKEQAQQTHRAFYHASLLKSAGLPCAALKKRRATKPFNEIFPVLIQKRFVSHPTLNHKSIPTSKNILTPMPASGRGKSNSRPKMLGELQPLRLVVGADALAVHGVGPRQHFLVDEAADDLTVLE